MYVVVHHTILDAETAFTRGQADDRGGCAAGRWVLQFYPSVDHSLVIWLRESSTVEDVQAYVDATLGDSSENGSTGGFGRGLRGAAAGPTGERTHRCVSAGVFATVEL